MAGEFLYFGIYVLQQLGIMLGVGAQTVLLCMHLTAMHHAEKENPHASYVHAARFALGIGLMFIFVSGLAAVAVHAFNGQGDILFAPAFLFKWLLIVLLIGAFFVQGIFNTWGSWYYAFTGGTWYALFLVHSLGPVTSWLTLWILYILWLIFFGIVWAAFTAVMGWRLVPITAAAPVAPPVREAPPRVMVAQAPPPPPAPKPIPPPPPPPKPVPPPAPPAPIVPPPPPAPKPVAVPPPPRPPAPKPAPPPPVIVKPVVVITAPPPVPVQQPVVLSMQPAVKKVSWWRRLFSWHRRTEEIKILPASTPAPAPVVVSAPAPIVAPPPVVITSVPPPPPPPAPKLTIVPPAPAPAQLPVVTHLSLPVPPPPPPVPKPVQVPVAPPPQSPNFIQDVIDHLLVPALHIMPQRPEDIGKQKRPPVVKLS